MIHKNVRYILAVLIVLVFSSVALAGVPVEVFVGKGTIVTLKEPSKRVSISNPDIADMNLISPTEVIINGKKMGSTNLIVWDKLGKATFFDINVIGDINLKKLETQIKEAAPNDNITVEFANDTIILSGKATNQATITKVVQIAQSYALGSSTVSSTSRDATGVVTTTTETSGKVLNHIIIENAQQILLEVKVAQINKSKMKELGISVLIKGTSAEGFFPGFVGAPSGVLGGGTSFNSNSLTTTTGTSNTNGLNTSTRTSVFDNIANTLLSDVTTNNTSSGPNNTGGTNNIRTQSNSKGTSLDGFDLSNAVPQIGVTHFASGISVFLRALTTKGYGKILAEPNLVVRSGEKGEFHVGQRFPVQTVTGAGADATVGITYEDVGVKLNFGPEVLENGAIRLTVDPAEVSNIVDFVRSQTLIAPVIDTRTIKTKVDLREGESLILAGLLRDQITKDIQKIPLLGDIPILGAFFRNTTDQTEETELVFFITPKLVQPLAPGTKPELPTDKALTPEQQSEFDWIPLPKENATIE